MLKNDFVSDSPSLYTVYAGSVDLSGNGETHDAAEFVVHEDYNPNNQYINDIALVRVSKRVFLQRREKNELL